MFKNALGAPWQVQKFSEILRPVTCDLRIEWNSTVQDAFGILYKDPCLLFGRSDTDLGRFKNFVRTFARGWGRNFIRILPLAGIRLIFLSELCFWAQISPKKWFKLYKLLYRLLWLLHIDYIDICLPLEMRFIRRNHLLHQSSPAILKTKQQQKNADSAHPLEAALSSYQN